MKSKLVFALFLVAMLFVSSSAANNVTIGDCQITLDFEDRNIWEVPIKTSISDSDVMSDITILADDSTEIGGSISLIDLPKRIPINHLNTVLQSTMKLLSGRVSTEPYNDGYIATGRFKDGGQNTWGVIFPLDNVDGQMSRYLSVMAQFEDGDFNERLIKSVSIEDFHCP